MKHVIFFSIISFFSASTFAQPGMKRENIEAYRIAYLTKELSLSSEEAKVFWPVYNAYQAEIQNIRQQRKKAALMARTNTLSDKELEIMVDNELMFKQSILNVEKKYNEKFKQVLPIGKVAKLYQAEEGFKRELVHKIQER